MFMNTELEAQHGLTQGTGGGGGSVLAGNTATPFASRNVGQSQGPGLRLGG